MPGHGAQISPRAPIKGYVQTGAQAPGTMPERGLRTPNTNENYLSSNNDLSLSRTFGAARAAEDGTGMRKLPPHREKQKRMR